jgi:hypothetical protein
MTAAGSSPTRGGLVSSRPSRSAVRLAWSLWGLTMGLVALAVWLEAFNGSLLAVGRSQNDLALVPMSLAFATVGALIAARHPRNPIGWLCGALGLVVAMTLAGNQYAIYALVTAPGSLPGGDWAAWWAVWPIELTILLPVLVFVLFPHGHLLSPRWRPLVWLAVATGTFNAAASALSTVNFPNNVPFARHPLALVDADAVRPAYGTVQVVQLGILLLAGVSLVVRLRRARGQERQQLKWLTYVSAVGALAITGAVFVTDQPVIVAVFWFPAVAIAIGVAIFKYRLYDIDRIINRTLVYGLLTALLGAAYAGLVLVLGQVFGGIGARPPTWAVAGATLAVAALFQPARRRIQAGVDRRFNRRRYDAAETIEAFSTRLRDQIDLDTLSAELLAVVDQTMQPTRVSLWLRPAAHGSSGAPRSETRPNSWAY